MLDAASLRAALASGAVEPGLAELLHRALAAFEARTRTEAATDEPMATLAPESPEEEPPRAAEPRYERSGLLGEGGMSQVWLGYDRRLQRHVALKALRPTLDLTPAARARFLRECRISAQLQHPAIVPVHDLVEVDGRLTLVLKVVEGPHLRRVIDDLHAGREGSTLRRTLAAFARACEAVAYAHSRGVVHRDLKPDNVMVGDYGQVLVLDWGLARRIEEADDPLPEVDPEAVHTRLGAVMGTPHYLAPEQARGERVDHRADVYSLGAMLHEVLTGRYPFPDLSHTEASAAARRGEVPPLVVAELPEPTRVTGVEELVALALRALSARPEDRPASAAPFAEALHRWLDGAHRREQALVLVGRAKALGEEEARLRAAAAARQAEAQEALRGVPAAAPVEAKAAGWAAEDEARALLGEAQGRDAERVSLLQAALTYDPDLAEAHAALADHYQARHAAAEAARRDEDARRAEAGLRRHDRGRWARWLAGTGALTLHTDPPGAEAELWRLVERGRRLVPERVGVLGVTPLVAVDVPHGRYVVRVRAEGRAPVDYPVLIRRLEHWDGVPPGGSTPLPVPLPRVDELGPDEVYVPPGPARLGEEGSAVAWSPRVEWVDGFVVRRFPVTHGELIAWLDALVDAGQAEAAERWQPRVKPAKAGETGAACYGRDDAGHFRLVLDPEGDLWDPRFPAFNVPWTTAVAYAAWAAEREGVPWRLPAEREWEKAARGVDGRTWPWGDTFDPAFARVRENAGAHPLPARVEEFPLDVSVYGVRGCAGNVREWCADLYDAGGARVVRGGAFYFQLGGARPSARMPLLPDVPSETVGFRLARSWPTAR